MPLPEGSATARIPWPPEPLDVVQDKLREWAAWYSGDPDQLATYYGLSSPANRMTPRPRPGLKRRLQRMWWGESTPTDTTPAKIHVPVASDLAVLSADLLFGESPKITVEEHPATQARIDQYIDDGLFTDLREAAEAQSALGGVFLRVAWDDQVSDRPWLAAGHADAVVAEWRWNRLWAATFWRVVETSGDKVLRHLERHEHGKILHGLYEGTNASLGRRVPLTENDETAGLAEWLSDGDKIETGVDLLTAVYIPNVRPNRIWRDVPPAHNLGRSDYQGCEPFMDSLDETYYSWMRDLRLGKALLIMPQSALVSAGPGQGVQSPLNRELFMALDGLTPEPGGEPITQVQFKIRFAEHEATAMHLLSAIVRSSGYGMLDFSGESPGQGMTATETNAKSKRTLTTRDRKIAYWTRGLKEILEVLLAVDQAKFASEVDPQRPKVEFPDAVSSAPKEVAETVKLLTEAKAATTTTLITMLHPDWTSEQIQSEVDELESKATAMAETMKAAFGGQGPGDPDDPQNGPPGAGEPPTSPGG